MVDKFSDDVVGEVKVASGHFIGVGQFIVVFDGDLEVAAIEVTEPHVAELEASFGVCYVCAGVILLLYHYFAEF